MTPPRPASSPTTTPSPTASPSGDAAVQVAVEVDQAALLGWAEARLRDLPWRRTRDPWAVLVSEVMAQQTGVDRVVPRYLAFLDRFPDPVACAQGSPGEVLRLWAGLGYNRRALHLHGCAVAIAERHGGQVPDRLADLVDLPGVGAYTARAVLAFAFEQAVGVVDTNVGRVLARWHGRRLAVREAQDLADSLVPADLAWSWNQAVMELGAVVCRRRSPDCAGCPLVTTCAWHARDRAAPDPADGSAAVSRGQSRFEGSDRQGRGRLVDALRAGPVPVTSLPAVMGWPDDPARAHRVAATLIADGLALRRTDHLQLP